MKSAARPKFRILNNPQTDQTLTTASRQFQSSPVFVGETDFFGFFGALKKGDFFGVHPKKVGRGQRAGAQGMESCVPVDSSKSFSPRLLRARGRGRGAQGVGRSANCGARKGDFFGVHPKKVRRGEKTGLGPPGSNSFSNPVFQPEGPATLRHKVWPKNFVSQLPGTSDVATN